MSLVEHYEDRENENVNNWIKFGMKLAVQSVLHPFEYSKVLIQVEFNILVFTFSWVKVSFR